MTGPASAGSLRFQTASPTPDDIANALLVGLGVIVFLVVWVVAIALLAVWLHRDCRRRGESPGLWVTLFCCLGIVPPLPLVVLLVYRLARRTDVRYDDRGALPIPLAPPLLPGELGFTLVSGFRAKKARCPGCKTVFPYVAAATGPSRLKCPACGREGHA